MEAVQPLGILMECSSCHYGGQWDNNELEEDEAWPVCDAPWDCPSHGEPLYVLEAVWEDIQLEEGLA
jgi:hypothetical protein